MLIVSIKNIAHLETTKKEKSYIVQFDTCCFYGPSIMQNAESFGSKNSKIGNNFLWLLATLAQNATSQEGSRQLITTSDLKVSNMFDWLQRTF